MEINIKELKRGVRTAQVRLVDTYKDFIYTIARRMLRQEILAEEAVQQVFIKIFQNIDRFEGKSKLSTWIYTIAYRTCLNVQASAQNRLDHDTLDEEIHDTHLKSYLQENKSEIEPFNDTAEILWQAVDALKQPQGIVLTLFYLNGLHINEIATMMDISESTVKTHLFRGRKSLRTLLLKNYAEEDLI